MREIRFRYTWKRNDDGHIWQEIVPIECLEGNGDKPGAHYIDKTIWTLVGRDLYTGLKDSEGKAIWEGDVVGGKFMDENVGKVIYDNAQFCIECASWKLSLSVEAGRQLLTVLGNIYENPELPQPKTVREE